ncbi:MAG: translation elongation factor Ts [Candidatus Marinimicrobia bacterium]|nr:translation elongation factor Ts [Candidatus Neomarinimicrobiota bacterium]RKY60893.1 MAG: elongation factor Ts [Candidatus Neomarinimicrobiota bacterium]
MEITATQVKELRNRTGIGMMDCKAALIESAGDIDKAIEILRKKGKAKAEKKADRDVSEGVIWSYIHPGNKIGVMVEVNCETDFVAKNEGFLEFVKDIAMHIAATNPAAIRREEIDAELVAKEREIYMEQARSQNKPEHILERIVDGKLEKFYQESCLLEQAFVKDPQKTIKDYLTETIARIGENINIARFVRFQLGEAK